MKGKALLILAICILFVLIGAVSASDVNDVSTEDLNLVQDAVSVNSVSMDKLEVSSNNSISETNSHNYNLNQKDGAIPSIYKENEGSIAIDDDEIEDTSIIADNITLYKGNGTRLYATLVDGNNTPISNQTLIFEINGIPYTRTTNENGTCSMAINLAVGEYKVNIIYEGSDDYAPSETTCTVTVLPTLFGSDITKYYKNGTNYVVTLLNGTGQPYVNGTVTYNIHGVFYKRTMNENGSATLQINLGPGTYVVTAIAPNGEMISNNVTVYSTITGSNVVKYYKNSTQYIVSLLNGTGQPYVNATVTYNIHGVFYTRTTNEEGIAKFQINLGPGEYIVTAITPEVQMISNNVTILSRLVTDDLTKYYLSSKTFDVTVLGETGNPEANQTVTCNIAGHISELTTDEWGVAHLPVDLEPNQYTVTTWFEGDAISNNVTVNVAELSISGSDVQGFENKTIKFPVTLTYPGGEPVQNQKIIFKVDGKTYSNKSTDSSGVCTLNIGNLSVGDYEITYEYTGNIGLLACNGSNMIKVVNSTTIINGKDMTSVYGSTAKFSVTLKDLDLKPLANKTVTFNINAVDYNRTTNANGVASLNINLMPGNYTIKYSYSKPGEEDYACGQNNIEILKQQANLVAQDLEVKYGEMAKFTIEAYDLNKTPIKDAHVVATVNGNKYTLVLNQQGKVTLNVKLPVGIFDVAYKFSDDACFTCAPLYNTITVIGYTLSGNDVTVSKGTQSYFEVTLMDTYGTPVGGKAISFEIAGTTLSAVSDENGIAKVLLPALDNDAIVYYSLDEDKQFKGENTIHIQSNMKISTIINAALALKNYIESNSLVPDAVAIDGVTYTTAQFLYLLSKATVSMSNGVFEGEVPILDVANPVNGSSATVNGNLYKYVDLANNLITYIEANGVAPVSMNTDIGMSGFYPIVYALARTVAFYQTSGVMPAYVSLKSVSKDIPYSPLDDHNTITDLEPYLKPTKNCQVDSEYIQTLADTLTAGLTSEWAKAQAIFNYVRDHVSYSFYYNTRYGAIQTLKGGTANCCDHAHAVVALARAAGLPARYVHGTCRFTSGSTYGHVWAQILIGDTWVVADATSTRNSLGIVNNWNNNAYTLHGYYRELSF